MPVTIYPRVNVVDADGNIIGSFGGGGGGSDASAINQATQILRETEIRDRLPSALVGGRLAVDVQSLSVTVANAQLEIANDSGNPIPVNGTVAISNLSSDPATATLQGVIRDRLMPGGTTTSYLGSSSGANLKASAGVMYAITCSNFNSSIRYFQVFNQTSASALNDIPVRAFPIPPDDGLLLLGQDIVGGSGIILSVGISWGFSSTRLTYTAATASDAIVTVRWS